MELQIIVSKPCVFGGVDFSKDQSLIKDAVENGHKVCIISYLHGELERNVGYDIGACLNAEVAFDFEKELAIPGIYNAKVQGYNKPCKAYLWNENSKYKALVIDPTCKDDLEYVKNKFKK